MSNKTKNKAGTGEVRPFDALVSSTCFWSYNNFDHAYDTGCNHKFQFIEGDLEENEFKYCPFCSKEINDKIHTPLNHKKHNKKCGCAEKEEDYYLYCKKCGGAYDAEPLSFSKFRCYDCGGFEYKYYRD